MDANGQSEDLRAEIRQLNDLLVMVNDAVFATAGILGRVIVEAGLVGRKDLAAAIEQRAGSTDDPDHNRLLMTFGRAVRMNFPGGRFDVVEGDLASPRQI